MATPVAAQPPPTAIPLPLDAIRAFCKKWGVAEFALFGSVLRGDFRSDSDVDVLIAFEEAAKPTLFALADMQDELEALFGRKVDLLTRRGVEGMVNWYRRRHILDSARVIYER
jgi:uncharacterized protein